MKKITMTLEYQESKTVKAVIIAGIVTMILLAIGIMVNNYRMLQVQEQKTEQEQEKRKYIETWEKLQEIDNKRKATEVKTVEQPIEQVKQLDTAKIKALYQSVNSPITDKIDWLAQECENRGLNYKLVIAIQTQESGFGRYCHKGNCFGYGITDSGIMAGWVIDDYEANTIKILDGLANNYKVQTAEEMSQLGYNTRQSWIDNVNYFISKF